MAIDVATGFAHQRPAAAGSRTSPCSLGTRTPTCDRDDFVTFEFAFFDRTRGSGELTAKRHTKEEGE